MATTINPLGTLGTTPEAKPKAAAAGDPLANKDTFLKLLVAQIRNQDPMNPQDGLQFVSQLAQFSELEQIIGIHQQLQGLRQDLTKPQDPAAPAEPPRN